MGTTFRVDLKQDLVSILMIQLARTSPNPPGLARAFATAVYAAIET